MRFSSSRIWRILASAIWRFRLRTLAAVLLVVLSKLSAVAVPLVLKAIVDTLSRPEAVLVLPVAMLVGYAVMRFLGTLFGEIRDMVFARVTQRTVSDFLTRAFEHLHSLGPRFHTLRHTGALTRDVERGTAGIAFLLGVALFTIVPTIVEMAAVMAILGKGYSALFTIVMLTTFFVYAGFTVMFTARRAIHQRALNRLDSNANSRLVDSLLNYETVKYFTGEAIESKRFRDIMGEWTDVGVKNQKALSQLHIGQSTIIAVAVAIVMLLAGSRVVGHTMTVGDLVLINAYVIQVCLPLNSLGFIFREARDASIKAERLFDLLDEQPDIPVNKHHPDLEVTRGEIRFEHVSFGYDPSRPILHDVDFTIAPGSTVAVVGGSGSGKSTLVRLLLRFYDTGGGAIRIDGQDIREVNQRSLRASIGVVPQDTVMFNDTVAYNIGYARPEASHEEIEAAARSAHVHDFVMNLPEGYDTIVGERGLRLSGGERQRIAIARAILKNAPIIVFDEATSALDTRSERLIQDEFSGLARERTALLIAHRLSTVVDADQIIVLDHGRLVERGTHAELLALDGLYAQMWQLQQREREIEIAGMHMAMQEINLGVLVAGVVDGLRGRMQERRINLYTVFDSESLRVTGDLGRLHETVWYLLSDAVERSAEGARVELRAVREGPVARVSVVDSREPNPPDAPFIPTHAEDIERVMKDHDGSFEARQDGTTTQAGLTLPLRAIVETTTVDDTEAATRTLDAHALEGLRILSIDDSAEARALIATLLGMHGAQVTTAASGQEAVALLGNDTQNWPQVLLCDISLGDEDGYAVMARIRALETKLGVSLQERIPAIALTGLATPNDRMQALLAGFQLYLVKPVDPAVLVAAILNLAHRIPDPAPV